METEKVSTFKDKQRNQYQIMSSVTSPITIELFQAQADLYRYIYSFLNSLSVKWALELGIPDIIHNHGQPITLSELVSGLHVPPSKTTYLHRLMRLLVHNGLFAITKSSDNKKEEEEEAYVLTPISELLVKGTDHCLSSMVQFVLHPSSFSTFQHLGEWIQGEKATLVETLTGTSFYETLSDNPSYMSLFTEAMASDSQMVNLVLRNCKPVFEKLDSIVDVGGGNGSTAKILSEELPNLKCIVLDLPQVVANLSNSKNVSYVGGNMFKSIPQADAVLLKWVLHNWSDYECVMILKKCKEAISGKSKSGKVIIIDIVVNENEDVHAMTEIKLLFDIVMMSLVNGKERKEKEWAQLFLEAGFKDYKIVPFSGFKSLIELSP